MADQGIPTHARMLVTASSLMGTATDHLFHSMKHADRKGEGNYTRCLCPYALQLPYFRPVAPTRGAKITTKEN